MKSTNDKQILTELVKVSIAWHDAYKAVQAESDPEQKNKKIYEWETLEKKLQRMLDERQRQRMTAY